MLPFGIVAYALALLLENFKFPETAVYGEILYPNLRDLYGDAMLEPIHTGTNPPLSDQDGGLYLLKAKYSVDIEDPSTLCALYLSLCAIFNN